MIQLSQARVGSNDQDQVCIRLVDGGNSVTHVVATMPIPMQIAPKRFKRGGVSSMVGNSSTLGALWTT